MWVDTYIFNKAVHNLSSLNIPNNILKYLGFGIKFVPKPPAKPDLILPSFKDFSRRIRIKELFKNKDDSKSGFNPTFHVKSNWVPPISRNINIEQGLKDLYQNLTPLLDTNNSTNHNKGLNNIIPKHVNDFICNPDILIKPSDKNLGLTIVDMSWYLEEGHKQLSDIKFYTKLAPHHFDDINYTLRDVIRNGQNLISNLRLCPDNPFVTEQILKFLSHCLQTNRTVPTFHLIPKIHKNPIAGRPIVPSHSWITTGFSIFLDSLFQKVIPNLEYIIKDTKSLITTLESLDIPSDNSNIWLVTGDITSMYTNLPTTPLAFNTVLSAMKDYLPMSLQVRRLLRRVIEYVMYNNYFRFGTNNFRQCSGIAMGTPCAPSFANILMHVTEKSYFGSPHCEFKPLFYGRYIDDIFFIFKGTATQLNSFVQSFDTHRAYSDRLKITWTYSQDSIEFLDLVIHSKPGKLLLSTHQKALNKYLYIPFCSYHPKDNKTGFIKAELIRYIRNSSTYTAFAIMAKKFFARLRTRGYPPRYLLWVFSKVHYQDRSKYLEPSTSSYDPFMVPFVTTYNPIWESSYLKRGLRNFVKRNPTYKPMVSFKRNKTIGDILNKANALKLNRLRKRVRHTSSTQRCVRARRGP